MFEPPSACYWEVQHYLVSPRPQTQACTKCRHRNIFHPLYLWCGWSLQASISGLDPLMESLVWATLSGGPMLLMAPCSCPICFSWSYISCIVRDRWDLSRVWALSVSATLCWKAWFVSFQRWCIDDALVLVMSSTWARSRCDRDLAPKERKMLLWLILSFLCYSPSLPWDPWILLCEKCAQDSGILMLASTFSIPPWRLMDLGKVNNWYLLCSSSTWSCCEGSWRCGQCSWRSPCCSGPAPADALHYGLHWFAGSPIYTFLWIGNIRGKKICLE